MSGRQTTPWGPLVCFALTAVGAAGFAVAYVLDLGVGALGGTIGGAFASLALGLALWARRLDALEPEYVEERAVGPVPPAEYSAFREGLAGPDLPRSGLLWATLGLAGTALGGAALFPLRSLYLPPGEEGVESARSPDEILSTTAWRGGTRLVTEEKLPIRPEDLDYGSVLTALPEGLEVREHVDTTTVLVRIPEDELDLPAERRQWVVNGVVAYSKLCTHAGCVVGLYADDYRQLLCPCHQSVFDARRAADPIAGPASRPLPQLPLAVDDEGYLVALGDFTAPVAAGWWGHRA